MTFDQAVALEVSERRRQHLSADSLENPITVVNTYLGALGEGDVASAMAQFHPEVRWHQPGSSRFSGVHVGPDAVGALIGAMMEASQGSFSLEVTGAPMSNGDLVAVPVRFSGRRGDATMDMPGVDLLRVRDSRIVEVHLFSGDQGAEDRFWGTERR